MFLENIDSLMVEPDGCRGYLKKWLGELNKERSLFGQSIIETQILSTYPIMQADWKESRLLFSEKKNSLGLIKGLN